MLGFVGTFVEQLELQNPTTVTVDDLQISITFYTRGDYFQAVETMQGISREVNSAPAAKQTAAP